MRLLILFALGCGPKSDGASALVDYNGSPDTGMDRPAESDADVDADSDADADTDDPGGDTGPTDTGEPTQVCDACSSSPVSAVLELPESSFVAALEATRDNPLKGFMTSYLWGDPYNDFPDQMEFLYIPLAQLWDESGETLETGLEPYLVQAEARGHHAVLRVFVDYPNRPTGLPPYLDGVVPCSVYTEHGGGCSPDYEHPALQDALFGVISALGERYDGDPRLGFVQVGLLGFWGEWHTWPHSDWFPSAEMQDAILGAYEEAFEVTQLQLRYPISTSVERRIGFHDDSFAHSTLGDVDWFFWPRMEEAGAADRWQVVPIGGELRPELQGSVYGDDYVLGEYAQDIDECIAQTRATYLLNYYAFNGDGLGYTGIERERAEASALAMGYTFEIRGARVELADLLEGQVDLTLEVDVAQTGTAPFYYPLYLSAESSVSEAMASATDNLSEVLPGDFVTVRLAFGRVPVDVLTGPISLELSSPMLQPGQRIRFATETSWSVTDSAAQVQWSVACAVSDGFVGLGDAVGQNLDGCDCICDVDGLLRTCHGDVCSLD